MSKETTPAVQSLPSAASDGACRHHRNKNLKSKKNNETTPAVERLLRVASDNACAGIIQLRLLDLGIELLYALGCPTRIKTRTTEHVIALAKPLAKALPLCSWLPNTWNESHVLDLTKPLLRPPQHVHLSLFSHSSHIYLVGVSVC